MSGPPPQPQCDVYFQADPQCVNVCVQYAACNNAAKDPEGAQGIQACIESCMMNNKGEFTEPKAKMGACRPTVAPSLAFCDALFGKPSSR